MSGPNAGQARSFLVICAESAGQPKRVADSGAEQDPLAQVLQGIAFRAGPMRIGRCERDVIHVSAMPQFLAMPQRCAVVHFCNFILWRMHDALFSGAARISGNLA